MEIYAAKLHGLQESEAELLLKRLDKDRQKKVAGLKNPEERGRSIFAGLLLRHAFLEDGHDTDAWQQIRIEKGFYGKPCIKGYEDFHYSLSHSGEWIICAVDSSPVGADIQEMKDWKPRLAKRFYHESEYSRLLIRGGPDTDKTTREFYSMWTAKESVVKLTGRGIGAGIDRYVTAGDYACVHDLDGKRTFPIRLYDGISGYMACVCSKKADFPEKLEIINL